MKLIIHDRDAAFAEELRERFCGEEELLFITEEQEAHHCVGCFGCWVKTPMRCVIQDGYGCMPETYRAAGEVILISRCVYGAYSPFVKNIMDRSIGYIHPYFVKRGGEMHHRLRDKRILPMRIFFYGDVTGQERATAERIARANALNFNADVTDIQFLREPEEITL